jgi:membrane fusion protein, multidrug efflux system
MAYLGRMDPLNWGRNSLVLLGGALAAGILGGCGKSASGPPPPTDVQVITVQQKDVPVVREWVGSLDGFVNAQIRAQVTGYIVKQAYEEGSFVKKGAILFEIDPRPFIAADAQAGAMLAQAKAQLGKAELDVKRDTPLVADKAISQEELDDAVQAKLAAEAQVEGARAAVDTAKLNLEFTHVTAPVDGIAGLISTQIGDLVGPATGPLTTVSQVDPIKAYFPISEQAYLEFRGLAPGSPSIPTGIKFDLILSDGSTYPHQGTFFAIDSQVEANTGTLRVVAVFPNPDRLLRAGQYAKVRAVVSTEKGAFVVPQRALTELQGAYQLATVDSTNHAHILTVKTGATLGHDVVVESGLHPGDRIVADGIQKVADGGLVNPIPFGTLEAAK